MAVAVAMAVVICSADSLNLGTGRFPAPRRVADISDPRFHRESSALPAPDRTRPLQSAFDVMGARNVGQLACLARKTLPRLDTQPFRPSW